MTLTPKPCEISCPKCGSANIGRIYYAKGTPKQSKDYGKSPGQYFSGVGTYFWKAVADHILHHCGTCRYEWSTKPLKSGPKPTKKRGKQ